MRRILVSLTLSLPCLLCGTAFGQADLQASKDSPGFLPWLISVGIFVLVAAVGFINSKRSHLN